MKILITDPVDADGLGILRRNGYTIRDYADIRKEEYENELPSVDGWILRSGTTITAADLSRAQQLKVIGRAGVGLDNIDTKTASERGITVLNTPDANTIAVAEHVMGLILTLLRHTVAGHQMIASGQWNRHQLIGNECYGKTLGIVGLGKIGRAVAERAQAFGMTLIGYDPYVNVTDLPGVNIQPVAKDLLIETADIITLHVPAITETENLVDATFLAAMKSSAYLINCARGRIVNETALIEALMKHEIAGAAMDVFRTEPPENYERLARCPNIVLTPHLGAATQEAKKRVSVEICTRLVAYLKSGA
ncbi:MAG: hydroxyacid dehydrogenase [Fidelibacterota bacterium]